MSKSYNKKIVILLVIAVTIFLTGCKNAKENTPKQKTKKKPVEQKEIYKDSNNMPISLYQDKNKLVRVNNYNTEFSGLKDIAVFQIFPSQEENIVYTNKFAEYFYERWNSLNHNNKIGFNVKYSTIDKGNLSYNILNPSDTITNNNYLLIYLYDDYYHRNDPWY